jgi:endonuclease-3 related protein
LRKAGLLSLPGLASADVEDVRVCIQSVSFTQRKAKRLVQLAGAIAAKGFDRIESFLGEPDTAGLRKELLAFEGVGPETADAILCFASDRHPTFIADEYARRAFRRLGLLPGANRTWSYEAARAFIEPHIHAGLALYEEFDFPREVPREVALCRDFHAQLVELGRHHCLKDNPRCDTRGGKGWKDYPFCRGHCREGACSACPLRPTCEHRSDSRRSSPS